MTTEVKTETFFCQACLERKILKEQSYDERYCQPCADFLKLEAVNYEHQPRWAPRSEPVKPRNKKDTSVNGKIKRYQKVAEERKVAITAETALSAPVVRKKAVTRAKTRESIAHDIVTVQTDEMLQKIMALREERPKITTREIAMIIGGVSHMTIARKLAGQRSLI